MRGSAEGSGGGGEAVVVEYGMMDLERGKLLVVLEVFVWYGNVDPRT